MPQTQSSTQTTEPKSTSSYRIRTMAGDVESVRKGTAPSSTSVDIDLPKETEKIDKSVPIKPSFPKIEDLKQQNKDDFFDILKKSENQQFQSPIKGNLNIPKQQTTMPTPIPPPNLPTTPIPQAPPPRPIVPVPPPMPKIPSVPTPPQIPQAQKLPSIPKISPLPVIKQPELPKAKSGKGGRFFAILIVSILIIGFIAGEIWYFFLREETSTTNQNITEVLPPPQNVEPFSEETEIPETIVTEEPEIPSPILSYSRSETIDLETLSSISSYAGTDELVRIAVKSINEEGINEYSDIVTIANQLNIKIPNDVSKEFSGNFDVFLFGGNSIDKETCENANIKSSTCYGPRLGMAIKVADPEKVKSFLKTWEKTMVTDLKQMILSEYGKQASYSFLTNNYQGQTIRYINIPINTITIEYSLVNDVLIISTSKSSIYKAIDSVVGY